MERLNEFGFPWEEGDDDYDPYWDNYGFISDPLGYIW